MNMNGGVDSTSTKVSYLSDSRMLFLNSSDTVVNLVPVKHALNDKKPASALWETETRNESCWYVCGSIMRYNECSLVSTSYRR